jgi:hypothetical protein
MSRHVSICAATAGVFVAALASVAASSQASWAQDDPTRQWFICYGPQAQGRLTPPKTLYVSRVSTAIRVTGQTNVLATEAFHAFALQKYGADFAPRCDWYSTEAQARGMLNYIVAHPTGTVVQTAWVWTQPEADKAPRPAPTPKAGALEH